MAQHRTRTVSALDGSTFVVAGDDGQIDPSSPRSDGLFARDTRFLSKAVLTVDGEELALLSVDTSRYWALTFFLFPDTGKVGDNPTLSVIRHWLIGDGMRERLVVVNSGQEAISPKLRLDLDADFADLFEVKGACPRRDRHVTRSARDGRLEIAYGSDGFRRALVVMCDGDADVDERGVTFRPHIGHGELWETELELRLEAEHNRPVKYGHGGVQPKPNMELDLQEWLASAPALETDWDTLDHTYQRSLVDLAALRFYPDIADGRSLPAAGLPWFMALFGRDSLVTSFQALPFVSELAATTLDVLAARQADRDDPFRDAEPGKILHELRFGELAHTGAMPQSPYFGSADSTPLYLILLDEYHRVTGDDTLVRRHRDTALRALDWIDHHGDRNGDGYVDYERRNTENGLENQCWKDSWNSIVFPDGTMTALPRATCEIQGYVYAAWRRSARLAHDIWDDPPLTQRLESQADALRERFQRDFWIEKERFYGLAIDGEGRRVDTITSNAGQLLWTGIAGEGHAGHVAERLMGDDLYSGWGVRTLAAGQPAYNPIEYHNGTVWPHDNSLIALGLAQTGHRPEALRIVRDMLEAAEQFDHRLPEVFAGYPREQTGMPVRYPTACSPQAWASGAPLLLLRAALELEPGHQRCVERELPNGRHVRLTWPRVTASNRSPAGIAPACDPATGGSRTR
jgi:glycogen debranching enzyme